MNEDEIKFSKHVEQRIEERNLNKNWIIDTIKSPDKTVEKSEKEVHYFKIIVEYSGKILKVVFNPVKKLVVTAHFDRNMNKNSNL
ncbi:MAG: DUF4258 domain-containing protein [Bacteroidales bacterium]